jgi:hypothetical protein
MASRKTKVPATKAETAHDPRVAALLKALRTNRELGPIVGAFKEPARQGSRKFGSNGLKVNGKLFALFTQGTLVVKLPSERVTALVAQRVGKPFDPGHGRLMKGWLTVTSATASWPDLVKEAHAFVKETNR